MEKVIGKKEEVKGSEVQGSTVQGSHLAAALRDGIDGLHARRGELVMQAKSLRERGDHAGRAKVWERVEKITLQIEQSEADLEAMGGRDAAADVLKQTVYAITDVCSKIHKLSNADAYKAIEVFKAHLRLMILVKGGEVKHA